MNHKKKKSYSKPRVKIICLEGKNGISANDRNIFSEDVLNRPDRLMISSFVRECIE